MKNKIRMSVIIIVILLVAIAITTMSFSKLSGYEDSKAYLTGTVTKLSGFSGHGIYKVEDVTTCYVAVYEKGVDIYCLDRGY